MTGDSVTVDSMTGDNMTGDSVTVDSMTGDNMTGYSVTGDSVTVDSMTGDPVTGDSMTGDSVTGDSMIGDSVTVDSMTATRLHDSVTRDCMVTGYRPFSVLTLLTFVKRCSLELIINSDKADLPSFIVHLFSRYNFLSSPHN